MLCKSLQSAASTNAPSSCLLCLFQSFTAALQTQWSWILQLCCCIEAHLKENTAYYQVWVGYGN